MITLQIRSGAKIPDSSLLLVISSIAIRTKISCNFRSNVESKSFFFSPRHNQTQTFATKTVKIYRHVSPTENHVNFLIILDEKKNRTEK